MCEAIGIHKTRQANVLEGVKRCIFRSELERFTDSPALVEIEVMEEVVFGDFLHLTAVEAAMERHILLMASY